ncbi:MAG: hypothetical protein SV375_04540 [Thermodesulfobacteriota bacterium]|nr:hypothetical protein [Thermodesulfobacteriota bacterium]
MEVCKKFAVDKEAVIKKGMKRNKTRNTAIYLSGNHCGITSKELGMYSGNVSGTTITMACNRVEKGVTHNRQVRVGLG